MKRISLYIIAFIAILFIIYSIIWFSLLSLIAGKANLQYADKTIILNDQPKGAENLIKFTKIIPAGFPFKIGFKIKGFTHETRISKNEFNNHVKIIYDLLKQDIIISYSGEILSQHKLALGFGAKILNDNYSLAINLPLSTKLFKIIKNGENPFQIVNFIKYLKINSNKLELFDLVNQEKIYDREYENIKISMNRDRYYQDFEDFKNYPPHNIDISYSTNVTQTSPKIVADFFNIFYGFLWNIPIEMENILSIKNLSPDSQEKNYEINLLSSKINMNSASISSNFSYKTIADNKHFKNVSIKGESLIELKKGIFKNLFDALNIAFLTLKQSDTSVSNYFLIRELHYILSNRENFKLEELENKKYSLSIDTHISKQHNKFFNIDINNLSLFSGRSGILIVSHSSVNALKNWSSDGLVNVNNFPKIIDITLNNLYMFGKYRNFSAQNKEIYRKTMKYFLKDISDHPKSTSEDLSFKYDLKLKNLKESKIGSYNLDQLKHIYHIALFHQILKDTKNMEKVLHIMKEFDPNIDTKINKKMFEMLMKNKNNESLLKP